MTAANSMDLQNEKRDQQKRVPEAGVEPARPNGHMALNHACLPIPASGQIPKQ